MATLTQSQIQQILIDELLLTDDAAITTQVSNLMPLWFSFYGSKSQELQYWYVRRCLLMFVQAQSRYFVDTTTGPDRVSANQFFKNATVMLAYADQQINTLDTLRGVPTLGSIEARGSLPDSLEELLLELLHRSSLSDPETVRI